MNAAMLQQRTTSENSIREPRHNRKQPVSYSKRTLYIVQKLDAIHDAIHNIRSEKCGTDTAEQLSAFLVRQLEAERKRLVQELERIANKKSYRAAANAGLPVQQGTPRHYQAASAPQRQLAMAH
jgi:hypothetical protein